MNKHELYLQDTIRQLVELAEEARDAQLSEAHSVGKDGSQFATGRAFGLMEATSLLHQQMIAFDLDPSILGFPKGFNAERELLK